MFTPNKAKLCVLALHSVNRKWVESVKYKDLPIICAGVHELNQMNTLSDDWHFIWHSLESANRWPMPAYRILSLLSGSNNYECCERTDMMAWSSCANSQDECYNFYKVSETVRQ